MAVPKLGKLPQLNESDTLLGDPRIRFEVERGSHCQHEWEGLHWHISQYGVPGAERDRIETLFKASEPLYFDDGQAEGPVEVSFGNSLRIPLTEEDEETGLLAYDLEYEVHVTRTL